jgi:hypothetical protein
MCYEALPFETGKREREKVKGGGDFYTPSHKKDLLQL